MRLLAIAFILFVSPLITAQKNVFLTLTPKVAGSQLSLASDVTGQDGIKFNVDHFNYYVSGVQIVHDMGQVTNLSDTVFFVNTSNFVLYLGYLTNVNNIEQINFSIGVPPNLNTNAGADAIDISAYPVGHPLSFQDPSMHWGWSAGYMHMVVGGDVDSDGNGTVDTYYELHNLGNVNYKTVYLPITPTATTADQVDLYVDCNLDQWLKDIPLASVSILHGTNGYNGEVMKNVETEPVFTANATASIAELSNNGNLYFNQNGEVLSVYWNKMKDVSSFRITDISGRIIRDDKVSGVSGSVSLSGLKNGLYDFELLNNSGARLKSIKIMR